MIKYDSLKSTTQHLVAKNIQRINDSVFLLKFKTILNSKYMKCMTHIT